MRFSNFSGAQSKAISPFIDRHDQVSARPPANLLYRALDAILTAPLQPRLGLAARLRSLTNPATSKYDRVASAITLMPALGRAIAPWLIRPAGLPLAWQRLELLAYGSGSTVFLVHGIGGRSVVKVYRRSLGQSAGALMEIAHFFKHKYETVVSWYRGERIDLVPSASFLILHGPLLGRAAVGVIQPYIQGAKTDFFEAVADGKVAALVENEPQFRAQCRFFAEQTLRAHDAEGRCVDFLGRNNIMLVEEDGRHRLLVIDNGIFHLKQIQGEEPARYAAVERRIADLRSFLARLGDCEPAMVRPRQDVRASDA